MKESSALPMPIAEAVDQLVADAVEEDASREELLYARFRVVADLAGRLRDEEREVVAELRAGGATWQMVASRIGLTSKAVEQRYAARRKPGGKSGEAGRSEGLNRAQAATLLHTTADTITRHIMANPGASWYVRKSVKGRINEVIRIVDIDTLAGLIDRGGSKPGPKGKAG